jgi:uncharacterized membrane protein
VTFTRSSIFGKRIALTYLVAATAWLAALAVGPYLLTHRAPGTLGFRAAEIVYVAGGLICHQQSARSFHAWDVQLPVCARCTGLYLAAPVGAIGGIAAWRRQAARRDRWRWLLALAAAPTATTVALEWAGITGISAPLRAASSLPLGFAVSWLVAETLSGGRPRKCPDDIGGTGTTAT